MNARFVFTALLLTLTWSHAAEEETPKPTARELLRARLAEDAKKAPAAKNSPATTTSPTAKTSASAVAPATTGTAPAAPAPTATKAGSGEAAKSETAKARAAKEVPTVLPKVEVRKGRITELDQQLALQEQEIARERKNLQSSEIDVALNDAKVARPLAIFGGESTQFRKGVAAERVELMEAEKDILEAIARAKTREEKASLQKQLNELRAMRRELDKTMR